MKDMKELFQMPLSKTTVTQSITAPQTLRRALPLALVLAILSLSAALADGPTGWGGGSCREVTAFPANLIDPGVYCQSFKYIGFPLASGALITISADERTGRLAS